MEETFEALMSAGHEAVRSGRPEAAVDPWTRALQQEPGSLEARLNLATLLSQLRQPRQAFDLLMVAREQLWQHADACCNLAIAAEDAGQLDTALQAYQRTLALDATHVRALTNLSALAARSREWEGAVELARRAVQQQPDDAGLWLNLCDFLTGAGEEEAAADCADSACSRFPGVQAVALRRVVAHVLCARFDEATRMLEDWGPEGARALDAWLRARPGHPVADRPGTDRRPWLPLDLRELYLTHVFERMRVADWRHTERAVAVVKELVAESERTQAPRDWRDLQFHALQLPLDESVHRSLWVATAHTLYQRVPTVDSPPLDRRAGATGPVRLGMMVPALHDPRQIDHLLQWLQRMDRNRFEVFVYLAQPLATFAATNALQAVTRGVIAIDHFTPVEAAQRIRLDALDVMVDTTFYTPTCRPEILFLKVAPVQLRHQTWQRHQVGADGRTRMGHCDYGVGDAFTHPGALSGVQQQFGPVARWPNTCWLALPPSLNPAEAEPADRRAVREKLSLPAESPVLGLWLPPLYLDRDTFRAACRAVQSHPSAVLWMPPYGLDTRRHLVRSAQALGLEAARLCFAARGDRLQQVADLSCADLFLDSAIFSATGSVSDALFRGVPVVAIEGPHMAARLGASVLRAAGLPELVAPDLASMQAIATRLLAAAEERAALRQRLAQHREHRLSPLFDPDARVREWESALAEMARRNRNGEGSHAFDVASVPTAA